MKLLKSSITAKPVKEDVFPNPETIDFNFFYDVDEVSALEAAQKGGKKLFITGAAIIAGGFALASGAQLVTQQSLNSQQAQQTELQRQHETLKDIETYTDGYLLQKSGVGEQLAKDIDYSKIWNTVASSNTQNIQITGISTVSAGQPNFKDLCKTPNPYSAKNALGCVKVSGTTSNQADIGKYLSNLKSNEIYSDGISTESATNEGKTKFDIVMDFNDKSLSKKEEKYALSNDELNQVNSLNKEQQSKGSDEK